VGVYAESVGLLGIYVGSRLLRVVRASGGPFRDWKESILHTAVLHIIHMKTLYALELGRILYGERRSLMACKELELS